MKNKKIALELLNQMVEKAEKEDLCHKQKSYEEGRLEQATGESWMLFHLKALKELIEE